MFENRFNLPKPRPAEPAPDAFMMIAPGCLPTLSAAQEAQQRALYEWALTEARAVVQPSLLELDLLGVWN
ncbi:MAG: hypothetical protein U0840_30435 [Gemmataceae bacterium]